MVCGASPADVREDRARSVGLSLCVQGQQALGNLQCPQDGGREHQERQAAATRSVLPVSCLSFLRTEIGEATKSRHYKQDSG